MITRVPCRDCGSPTAVITLTTGGSVALDPDPVPSATASPGIAYAYLRGRMVKPLGDCQNPPAECLVRHRCPQMRENPHWTELMAITSDLAEWEEKSLRYAYPSSDSASADIARLA